MNLGMLLELVGSADEPGRTDSIIIFVINKLIFKYIYIFIYIYIYIYIYIIYSILET